MESNIRCLLATGKVMLAKGESQGATENLFQSINPASTEESRRRHRQLLFSTPKLGQFISGAVMGDDTIRRRDSEGASFVEILNRQGIIPGIKVDLDARTTWGFPGETTKETPEDLGARFAEYYQLGARFCNLRTVISIGESIPTDACVAATTLVLARYAACSQEAGLVPVVQLDALMGGDHTLKRPKPSSKGHCIGFWGRCSNIAWFRN